MPQQDAIEHAIGLQSVAIGQLLGEAILLSFQQLAPSFAKMFMKDFARG